MRHGAFQRVLWMIFGCLLAGVAPLGAQQFLPPASYPVGKTPTSVAVGNFNHDGKPDLAVADSQSGAVGILLGKGGGVFGSPTKYQAGNTPVWVAAADLNGDGNLDLAVADSVTGGVSVLLGEGTGAFQPPVFYRTGGCPNSAATGDLNGDHKVDLVVSNSCSSTVSVLLGRGNGTFGRAADYSTGSGSEPGSVVLGDLNGDGKPDVVTANFQDDVVSVLLGNGDGTLQPHVDYPTGTFPTSVALGDFNRDGILDLAVNSSTSYGPGGLSVMLGNGDGTFQPAVDYTTQVYPFAVQAGDFNRDGKLDLAVVSFEESTVDLFLGNGDGTFQSYVPYATGEGPVQLAVADLNGDHAPDIVTVNVVNTVSVLLNTGKKSGGAEETSSPLQPHD